MAKPALPKICSVDNCGKSLVARDPAPTLDQDCLKSIIDYDPATGVFLWKDRSENFSYARKWNPVFSGKEAGRIMKRKIPYRQIKIHNVLYYAHRLAWLYMTGNWPDDYVDHINGDGLDNRWSNLRKATNTQNQQNAGRNLANTVGYKGVCFAKCTKKYQASIRLNGKLIYLGQFMTPEEAYAAYCDAARKFHGEFANFGTEDDNAKNS
jgi:hypothetical protein